VSADGSLLTIDHQSPAVGRWSPLRFARVSLGGLGIVTSVTIDVLPRPYATSLQGGSERLGIADKSAFVDRFQRLLENHARLEIFFTAYAAMGLFPVWRPECCSGGEPDQVRTRLSPLERDGFELPVPDERGYGLAFVCRVPWAFLFFGPQLLGFEGAHQMSRPAALPACPGSRSNRMLTRSPWRLG
jgi:hypothetical protein